MKLVWITIIKTKMKETKKELKTETRTKKIKLYIFEKDEIKKES